MNLAAVWAKQSKVCQSTWESMGSATHTPFAVPVPTLLSGDEAVEAHAKDVARRWAPHTGHPQPLRPLPPCQAEVGEVVTLDWRRSGSWREPR